MKKTEIPTTIFLTFLAICLALTVAASAGNLPTLPSGKENPLPILYPELNSKPAPDWVAEGLRATYQATTNKGEALIQVDVVALEGSTAATSTAMYIQGPLGHRRPLAEASFGSIVPVGCGNFWCDPGVLQKAKERSDDDVVIIRSPLTVRGQTYQAVRFEIEQEGIRYIMTYDENTGLLIHHRYDILAADGTSTETGIVEFVNKRQVEIPWDGGVAPSWLRAGQTMTYQGQTVYQIPGSVDTPFPLTFQMEVVSVQRKSSVIKSQVQAQGSPSLPAYTVSGARQLMGAWLPQAALEAEGVGEIDVDPETGMIVSAVQNDEGGIVLEQTNGYDYQKLLTYDKKTGKLIQSYEEQLTEAITQTVQKTVVSLVG